MPGKRLTPEQIIGVLRQAEVELAQGRTVGEVCRGLEVSEASFYRWRSEYGGLKVDQARLIKGLLGDMEIWAPDDMRNWTLL
ncbi:MAG: transposase [Acetobacteraceae bacterium]|nr:transposase [Acetobacteraceae bacterium]